MKLSHRLLSVFACLFFLAGASAADPYAPLIGIQTWTLRNMTFEEVVDFATAHRIKYLEMISKHIDPGAPAAENKHKKDILDQKGLVCYSFGVNKTTASKEENRRLFEFAKMMGIRVIVVEPPNMVEWDNLEQLVKEYDIKLAVHNHGITTPYGKPSTVKELLATRDPRIGVCLDIGHVTGAGFDAAQVFSEYGAARVFDLHLKDKMVKRVDGDQKIEDVKIGTGQTNIKGILQALKATRWPGVMAIETDNADFAQKPDDYVDSAIKYVRDNQP